MDGALSTLRNTGEGGIAIEQLRCGKCLLIGKSKSIIRSFDFVLKKVSHLYDISSALRFTQSSERPYLGGSKKNSNMNKITLAALLLVSLSLQAQPIIDLQDYATGFQQPIAIRHAGDDRLFIVQQNGIIRIINGTGQTLATPFLNIDPRVLSGGEQGLLGLDFHPQFPDSNYFYVNYTNNSGDTRVSRFSVTANPNIADPDSEVILLTIDQPFPNHNGGDIHFGPDGYLYIGMGDGGSGGDPGNRAQNPTLLLGKMLRIDVDNGAPYAIPATNPFAGSTAVANEIWALGLRNPWRFSFDRLTGDLWIGDVGQDAWEEVDFQPASSPGGENYGWRCYEGNASYNLNGCGPVGNYTRPVAVYANSSNVGCSITGGYVYRGSQYPDLYGHYLYTDYCSGRIWSLTPDGEGEWNNQQLLDGPNSNLTTFGEDVNGELYLAGIGNGIIYKIRERCSTFSIVAAEVSDASCFGTEDGQITLGITSGAAPFSYAWSEGNGSNLAAGTYGVTVTDNIGCKRELNDIAIEQPDPVVVNVTADNATLTATGGFAQYQWFFQDNPAPDATDSVFVATETGNYRVEVVNADGCPGVSETIQVTITSLPADLGLERVKFSPNPFRETLRLEIDATTSGTCRFSILDAEGRLVQSFTENIDKRWSRRISTASWPAGSYWVRLEKNGRQLSYPVQKQ